MKASERKHLSLRTLLDTTGKWLRPSLAGFGKVDFVDVCCCET